MAKKEFTYRGKTLDELQLMSIKEFSTLTDASTRRKLLRGFTDAEKVFLERIKTQDQVKTHCRDMVILPFMVGKTILVHKGHKYEAVRVQPEMIGHRLGEFALTRNNVKHSAPGVGATRSSSAVSAR